MQPAADKLDEIPLPFVCFFFNTCNLLRYHVCLAWNESPQPQSSDLLFSHPGRHQHRFNSQHLQILPTYWTIFYVNRDSVSDRENSVLVTMATFLAAEKGILRLPMVEVKSILPSPFLLIWSIQTRGNGSQGRANWIRCLGLWFWKVALFLFRNYWI